MGEAFAVRILMDLIRRLDTADWNLPVYILSRLISADATLFRQFVQHGGLRRSFLEKVHPTNLFPTSVALTVSIQNVFSMSATEFATETWICTLSHIAKRFPESTALLKEADILTLLKPLFEHPSNAIRSKASCLIGNLCRHSNLLYQDLIQHRIPERLLHCLEDSDSGTRRFACFAIGRISISTVMTGLHLCAHRQCGLP